MARRLVRHCWHCNGMGTVEVTGVYADTFHLLAQQIGHVTGAYLARYADCKATAMNNRLAALEEMGLATSYRYGRQRLYFAKKQPR